MVQNTNEPVEVMQRSGVGSSVNSWAALADDTPVFARGDASAAARVAAVILDDARKIRRMYEKQMMSRNVDSRMLELHELLHDAERYGLAAQRHGVECLTARLRDDTSLVEQISAQTFEKTQLAARALADALNLIGSATREVSLDETAMAAASPDATPDTRTERLDVLDEPESERRAARADRARRIRPVPEQAPPLTHSRQYSLGDEPWPARNAQEEEEAEAEASDRTDPTVELLAMPVSIDVIDGELSTPESAEAGQLEVLGSSEKRAPGSPTQVWLYRGLVVVLVALIALGLWLLLSDNSFIG